MNKERIGYTVEFEIYYEESTTVLLSSFFKIVVECMSAELIDLLNLDIIYPLEFVWILDDINLIYESFYFVFFGSVPLQCNRAALTLISVA